MKQISKEERHSPTLSGFAKIIYIFAFCAIIGWVWEEAYCLVKHGFWVERGFLFGPWLPIYGFGGLLIYLIRERLIKHPLLLFPASVLFAGVLEYFAHWLLEVIFHKKWWNYSHEPLNINGRVEIIRLILFGLAGTLAACYVIPAMLRLIYRGRPKVMNTVAYVIFSAVVTDATVSIIVNLIT